MFIGHYGIALAAKRVSPKTSLGTLIMSAQLIDLLWPLLLLLGLEHVRIDPGNTVATPLDFYDYPITHSMLGCLGWAAVFGVIYRILGGSFHQAIILGGVVFSHWVLDAITSHKTTTTYNLGSSILIGILPRVFYLDIIRGLGYL